MNIGFFGGSFNPVHFGHLNFAIELLERAGLDQIWWIPANISPFREEEKDMVAPEHRLEMIKLAIRKIPQFSALDLEIKRPPPSYTIDTIEALVDQKNTYYLLLADDVYQNFHRWKDAHKIESRVKILVARRGSQGIEIPRMEISGTRIRERLQKKLYCGHLLPEIVLDYIYENQLYFNA